MPLELDTDEPTPMPRDMEQAHALLLRLPLPVLRRTWNEIAEVIGVSSSALRLEVRVRVGAERVRSLTPVEWLEQALLLLMQHVAWCTQSVAGWTPTREQLEEDAGGWLWICVHLSRAACEKTPE